LRVRAPSLPPKLRKPAHFGQASLFCEMNYFVYILQSEWDGSYYIGYTNNLEERINRHNRGRSQYTKTKIPWKLIYHEVFNSKSEAMRREREIKRMKSREYPF
jgi:putative endonuclease